MSLPTVALFVSLLLGEIYSGHAGMMPRQLPEQRDCDGKSSCSYMPTTSATTEITTTKEPIFGIIRYSPDPKPQCLKLKERCIDSNLFCCKTQELDNGELVDIDGFCYIFGGICESRVNFTNYASYVKLAKSLHKATWKRLNP